MHAKLLQLCLTLQPMDYSLPDSSVHGDSPDKNAVVGCHALFQGIFPTQGSNLHLMSPAASAWAGGLFTTEPPGKTRDSGPYLINAIRQMHKLHEST